MHSLRPFTLALLQMSVLPGEVRRNLEKSREMILRAASGGADIVLLPEALPFGWTDPSGPAWSAGIPEGDHCQFYRECARTSGVWVCTGIVERAGADVFNSAVLIDPEGAVRLHHRKVYELGLAHACYAQGDRLGVVDTPFGRVGLMICADAFVKGQVISRTLGTMGAQVIVSPCAWAVPGNHDNVREPYGQLWLDNYGPVASEFGLWIAGCSNVGPIRSGTWAGHRCIGCSLVVGPDGRERLRGSYGESAEEILYAQVVPEIRARAGAGEC